MGIFLIRVSCSKESVQGGIERRVFQLGPADTGVLGRMYYGAGNGGDCGRVSTRRYVESLGNK